MDDIHLKKFRNWMLGKDLATSTRQKKLGYIRRVDIDIDKIAREGEFYNLAEWVHEQKLTDGAESNMVKSINSYLEFLGEDYRLRKKRKKGDPDIWIPAEEEKKALLRTEWGTSFITARNQLFLTILFIAGLRRDEARTLKYSDFRYMRPKNYPEIRYYYIQVLGKGKKERTVDIPKELYNAVMDHRTRYGADYKYIFTAFIRMKKVRPISNTHAGRIARYAALFTGIHRFHAHAARHYRAVELYDQGVSLETLRKFLGHSDISTTQGYLRGRERAEHRRELINKDSYFEGLRTEIENAKAAPGANSNDHNGRNPPNPKHE